MIIKLIRRQQPKGNDPYVTTEVFEGISHYQVTQLFGDRKALLLTLVFKDESLSFDLLDYQQAYVMNDAGKTIETLRNVVGVISDD